MARIGYHSYTTTVMRSCKAVVFRAHLCSDTHTHVRGGPRRFPAARERVELTDLGCMVSGSPLVQPSTSARRRP